MSHNATRSANIIRLKTSHFKKCTNTCILDLACARIAKADTQSSNDTPPNIPQGAACSSVLGDSFKKQLTKLITWKVQGPHYSLPAEPHRVVLWAVSMWGVNTTRLETTASLGSNSLYHAISYIMLWSHGILPVCIREYNSWCTYDAYEDPRYSSFLLKVVFFAENFRWITKHLQTLPTYKKPGRTSWARLGLSSNHEGGMSRCPDLPNASQTYAYIHDMLLTMPREPPFHTEVLTPALQHSLPHKFIFLGRDGKRLSLSPRKHSFAMLDTHFSERTTMMILGIC